MTVFSAKAPARANIIGEHTDYLPNGGHVLPTPLPFYTTVSLERSEGPAGEVVVSSETFAGGPVRRNLAEERRGHWTDYVVGSLRVAAAQVEISPLTIHVASNIPIGAGISSSAALCVALMRAVKAMTGAVWTDDEIALMAYHAEHDYVGVPCGKMDQFASSVGRPGQALLLNTRTLEYRNIPLPSAMTLMLVDCGKKHDHAKGDTYTKRMDRMAECIEARAKLDVGTLCELGCKDLPRLLGLRDVVARRARHVITENLRVLEFAAALEAGNVERQADLVAASHVSQRDDFECSIPEIDALVESSQRFGIRAARLTGGGFGGSIIAQVPRERTSAWWSFVSKENPNASLISNYALNKAENEFAA